jgi:3-oxoacyl-[acyl-carrier protein] reductase
VLLSGKCALVCAASKGLGKAAALALAQAGARVAICARGREPLEAAADEIRAAGGSFVMPIVADVGRAEDVQRLVASASTELGAIDVLVTNTGGPPSGRFESIPDGDWIASFDSIVMSAVRLCRAVIPHMRQRGGGRIIHVTSVSVKQPIEGLVLSNALRAAVTGLSRTLANELAGDRILVNCLAPGYTATDRVAQLNRAAAAREGIATEEVLARLEQQIPLGRLGTPEEFAAAVTFLASPAASFITGTTLQVDGGYVKGLL